MHLKLNKDFMKNFKKSDQLEGKEKIFFQIKMFLKKMFDFKNIIDNELNPLNKAIYMALF